MTHNRNNNQFLSLTTSLKAATVKAATKTLVLAVVVVFVSSGVSNGSIIENGILNTIDQAGNASDGLSYLDVTFSVGLTKDQALTAAQALYADARLATALEFNDLFQAAGIMYDNSNVSAASGFDTGIVTDISTGLRYDGGALSSILGNVPNTTQTFIWTDPDGSSSSSTTRDFLYMDQNQATVFQENATPPTDVGGWLIVTGPATGVVPEPTSLLCWLGVASIGLTRRRRHQQ